VIKLYPCALAVLLVPASLVAQQTQTTASLNLPDAPQPTMQQQPTSSSAQQQPETEAERHAKAEEELKKEEHQRIAGLLPAFNSVIGGKAEPLTRGQKFHLFFRGSIDPYQFVLAGIDAGVEQINHTYPEYHYGIQGYSRRYAAAFGDNFDGNFWGNAVLPSLLHQDPRYFRLGHGTILHRALYSASTTIRTRSDKGRWQPAYSNLFGNLIGGAFSNLYYPKSDRGLGQTFSSALTVTYQGTFGALLLEFYPDISQHYKDKRARKLAAGATSKDSTQVPPQSKE
jgi:hypothetical protein